MANQLAYLIKRDNGRYYARFQQFNGRWTWESLGTVRAAEAKVLFDHWKQRRLRARELDLLHITPITLRELADLHLEHVACHQARSWLVKQRNYLENYVVRAA